MFKRITGLVMIVVFTLSLILGKGTITEAAGVKLEKLYLVQPVQPILNVSLALIIDKTEPAISDINPSFTYATTDGAFSLSLLKKDKSGPANCTVGSDTQVFLNGKPVKINVISETQFESLGYVDGTGALQNPPATNTENNKTETGRTYKSVLEAANVYKTNGKETVTQSFGYSENGSVYAEAISMGYKLTLEEQAYNYRSYDLWCSSPYKAHLFLNGKGGYTRVEYDNVDSIIVEDYSSSFIKQSEKSLKMELSTFGGFYAGKNYNFFVVGDYNNGKDDSKEVIRVIKYSKDWNRLGSVSIFDINTITPFDSGSCDIAEVGDYLYINTTHLMYNGHQASMNLVVDTKNMTFLSDGSEFMVSSNESGYVSHCFNQFSIIDGSNIYAVNHGDSYPRGIFYTKYDGTQGKYNNPRTKGVVYNIDGKIMNNNTGVEMGNLVKSGESLIVGISSVKMTGAEKLAETGKNIGLLIFSDTSTVGSAKQVWLTSYKESDTTTVTAPVVAKINDNKLLVYWEESDIGSTYESNFKDNTTSLFALVDLNGKLLSPIIASKIPLSHMNPAINGNKVVFYDAGKVCWEYGPHYNAVIPSSPTFYVIDCTSPTSFKGSFRNSAGSSSEEDLLAKEAKVKEELQKAQELLNKGVVARLFNKATDTHYFCSKINEIEALVRLQGCTVEGNESFRFSPTKTEVYNVPIYRLSTPGKGYIYEFKAQKDAIMKNYSHLWSVNAGGEPIFYVNMDPKNPKMYRMYNKVLGTLVYSPKSERDFLMKYPKIWEDQTNDSNMWRSPSN